MSDLPDSSNFYSSLDTSRSLRNIANLFGVAGWKIYEPDDWWHFEVHCSWAELWIESSSEILLHGGVADVTSNAERILAILKQAGIAFTAECYSEEGDLVREWKSTSPE